MNDCVSLRGEFTWERWSRPDEDGVRHLAGRGKFPNGITTAGLNDLLSAGFVAGTQRTWCVGLIDLTNFSALAAADTMASHAGWQEVTTYSGGVRPALGLGTPSAGVSTNATLVSFTFTAAATIHGMFVTSSSTPGGTSGILWSSGEAPADQSFIAGEILKIGYTLTAAAGQGS